MIGRLPCRRFAGVSYPFHCTQYSRRFLCFRKSRMSATSYSVTPSTSTGMRGGCMRLGMVLGQ
jgi:hypothetical protein